MCNNEGLAPVEASPDGERAWSKSPRTLLALPAPSDRFRGCLETDVTRCFAAHAWLLLLFLAGSFHGHAPTA